MASFSGLGFFKALTCLALALILCVQAVVGGITCENLDKNTCAFAVSSSGVRCVLEKKVTRGGAEKCTCRASEIEAEKLKGWIESDQCMDACGLHRNTLGISSDSLLESSFIQKLCSPQCFQGCPSIVDLYFNLAAGEGVFLPKLCEAQGANARRVMGEITSSGIVAQGPQASLSGKLIASAPFVAPGPQASLPGNLIASAPLVAPGPQASLPGKLIASAPLVAPGPQASLPGKLIASAPGPQASFPGKLIASAPLVAPLSAPAMAPF